MYFELFWGISTVRLIDIKAKYGKRLENISRIFGEKLKMILDARKLWPRYASLEEEESLRNDKWNKRYIGRRIVFWDGTDIRMPKP